VLAARGNQCTEVWPENWPVFTLFCDFQTQWRLSGMGGQFGLDYNVVFHKLDRMNLTPQQYEEWEEDIRTLEFAAIAEMNEKDD
jgi:hypothetical protein